ncbi:sensor histidine kinase [Sulfitobacter sp. EhC04]|uniref:sensor histidine kinase n=1 Tax=Sulfitobacter sp. EhC04 TaxID=1849168 RepID=UPI000832EC9C|nr:ATP-binding protein [Sulfitobacter sp. EhC04]
MTRVVLIAIVCGVIIAFGRKIESLSYQTYLQSLRLNTTIELSAIREKFESEMVNRVLRMNEIAAALSQNPDMNQTEFNIKAVDFLLENNDVINIAAAPDLVVTMVFPKTGNERVLGLDYRTNPLQFPKVAEAMRTGNGQIDGPVDLLQGGRGLILRQPVFTMRDGKREPWGLLSVVLDYDSFVDSISSANLSEKYDIVLRERRVGDGPVAHVLLGDVAALSRDPVVMTLNIPMGVWELAATPADGWPLRRPQFMWQWSLRLIFISLVAIGLFYVLRLADTRREAESRLTNGIEALHHGFVMFDPEGRLIAMNQKYAEMHGPSSVVKIGVHYEDIVKSSLNKGVIRSAVGREQEWLEEWRNRPLDGSSDPEQILPDGRIMQTSDRLMEDGSVVGLRIDVTDLKRAQQAAEAANKAKTDFMGVLSHELRTPLTVILGHARLARNVDRLPPALALNEALKAHPEVAKEIEPQLKSLTGQIVSMMTRLERSGEHLLSLISEILDFAKLESGSQAIQPTHYDINDIVGPVADQMRPMVEEKGLAFEVSVDPGNLYADANRVRQVLINLVGNAAKFTQTGSIKLDVVMNDNVVEFSVTDTGIGIPEDQVSRVFEAFHQVDATSTRQFGGTGLGLAISRDIAEMHGGTLTASSVTGQGSTFVMRLPREPGENAETQEERHNMVA